MLKFINRKIALQWILLSGLFAFSVYTIITKTQIPDKTGTAFLFQHFVDLFTLHVFLGKGIIIALLLTQIIFLQYYFKKNEYAAKKTLLPACFYLSMLLLTKSLTTISPFFFTSLFFLFLISIDFTVLAAKLKNNVFWTGILIAWATCFDPSSILLLFIAIVTLIINQFSKIKEIIILLFGFLLAYFYFFSYFFFTNNLNDWLSTFKVLSLFGIFNGEISCISYPIISLVALAIIYLYFIIRTRIINEAKIVKLRVRIFTFHLCTLLIMACIFITSDTYPHFLGYIFVPIAIYLTLLSSERNPLYINEIIACITFLLLCL